MILSLFPTKQKIEGKKSKKNEKEEELNQTVQCYKGSVVHVRGVNNGYIGSPLVLLHCGGRGKRERHREPSLPKQKDKEKEKVDRGRARVRATYSGLNSYYFLCG